MLDVAAIFISYVLAMFFRYQVLEADPGLNTLSGPYLLFAFIYSILIANFLWMQRSDGKKYFIDYENTLANIVTVNGIGCLFILAFFYISNMPYFSRWALVLFWVFATIALVIKNAVFNRIVARLRSHKNMIRVLIVGGGELAKDYGYGVISSLDKEFELAGYVSDTHSGELVLEHIPYYGEKNGKSRVMYLGKIADIDRLIDEQLIDEVVIALEDIDPRKVGEIAKTANDKGIGVTMLSKYSRYIPYKPLVRDINGADKTIRTIEVRENHVEKNTSLFAIIISIAAAMLLAMLIINTNTSLEFQNFHYYEGYKVVLFAIVGFFTYLEIQISSGMKIWKCWGISEAIMMAAIVIYEFAYWRGHIVIDRYFVQELPVTFLVITAAAAVKKVIDLIGRDDGWAF